MKTGFPSGSGAKPTTDPPGKPGFDFEFVDSTAKPAKRSKEDVASIEVSVASSPLDSVCRLTMLVLNEASHGGRKVQPRRTLLMLGQFLLYGELCRVDLAVEVTLNIMSRLIREKSGRA